MNQIEHDAKLILQLGGPTKVAALIGENKPGSVQRVQNWITRGIPAQVKVNHPHLFMAEFAKNPTHPTPAPHSAA